MSTITSEQLINFVYDEARLLDEQRYHEWLNLFAEDGYYWMPLSHQQSDPKLENSLLYEDPFLLRVRIERLSGERTYSQQPKSRSHHLLSRPDILSDDAWHQPEKGQFTVRVAFHYVESRGDIQHLFAAWSTFNLIADKQNLLIKLKRVDLLNSESALPNIQLFM